MKAKTKRRLLGGLALAVLLPAIGLAVAGSGVIPIAASSEHWPVTAWFLHFTMRQSVSLHSHGIEAPPLDDAALVRLGAGHYETGCRPCHGAPGDRMPPIAHGMTPHPPWLPSRTPSMDDAALFYTVRHGVKFTGMPEWPAFEREEEPWAVVAFLREMEGMAPSRYRALTTIGGGEGDAPDPVGETCARCHGSDGLGRDGTAPVLAGQRRAYLLASLEAYADGERHSGFMEPIAVWMEPSGMRRLATYYAALPGLEEQVEVGALEGEAAEGWEIVRDGIPSRRIPACADCHGPSEHRRNDNFPLLAGQDARWIEGQLEAFVHETRGGSEWVELMQPVMAHDLEEAERAAVAAFYAEATAARTR